MAVPPLEPPWLPLMSPPAGAAGSGSSQWGPVPGWAREEPWDGDGLRFVTHRCPRAEPRPRSERVPAALLHLRAPLSISQPLRSRGTCGPGRAVLLSCTDIQWLLPTDLSCCQQLCTSARGKTDFSRYPAQKAPAGPSSRREICSNLQKYLKSCKICFLYPPHCPQALICRAPNPLPHRSLRGWNLSYPGKTHGGSFHAVV